MSKPKFGVNSSTKNDTQQTLNKKEEKSRKPQEKEAIKFGTNSANQAKENQEFIKKGNTNSNFLARLFQSQSTKFWIIAYIYSLCLYIFNGKSGVIYLLDLVLFPFALILISNLVVNFVKSNSFAEWLDPIRRYTGLGGIIFIIFWYITKLILCAIYWNVSIILGVIGIIVIIKDSAK